MKFFKHFTDGHDSTPMTNLMEEFGLEGYAAFFILMELGIEKIEKKRDQELAAEDCRFRIHGRILRQKLRMRATKVELFLNSCVTQDLLNFSQVEDEFNFDVPKVLEFFDRDSKRARHDRAEGAPKKKNKKEIKKKNISAHELEMEKAFEKFPVRVRGKDALSRFVKQVIEPGLQADFKKAMTNYFSMLVIENWRKPKQSWETYLGAEAFWKEFVDWTAPAVRDPKAIIRAPLKPVPTEALKVDTCVGPLTDDGPRTFSPERLQELKRTLGVG